jgi:hypothetical protein
LPLPAQEAKVTAEPVTVADSGEKPEIAAPQRERGKPTQGATRRTKAEIAEDEAADKADAALRAAGEETGAVVPDKVIETGSNISTSPEDRQDPDNPDEVDSPEDAAQDAADEAAEAAAVKEAKGGKLTLDDVRTTLGIYVKAYGMDAAQKDGPAVIAEVCGGAKVSDIPDDKIEEVIAAIKAAGKANRFNRAPLVAG